MEAVCLCLYGVNCTTKDMIDPAGFAPRAQYDDIEKVPDLIIVSIMNELTFEIDSMTKYKSEVEQFIIKTNQLNKSVLLVFPRTIESIC